MVKSLFTGVSGLRSFQTMLDVISGNIANVDTPGYKRSRVSFKDLFYWTLREAIGPVGERQGQNPIQVGLGVTIGTVDVIHQQGSPETTNNPFDLAIEGMGMFILSNRNHSRYWFTRDGSFGLDAEQYLVDPSTGYRVQGWIAERNPETGEWEIDVSRPITDIVVPLGTKIGAKATTLSQFVGNLDSRDLDGMFFVSSFKHIENGTEYDVRVIMRQIGERHWSIVGAWVKDPNNNDWEEATPGITEISVSEGGAVNPENLILSYEDEGTQKQVVISVEDEVLNFKRYYMPLPSIGKSDFVASPENANFSPKYGFYVPADSTHVANGDERTFVSNHDVILILRRRCVYQEDPSGIGGFVERWYVDGAYIDGKAVRVISPTNPIDIDANPQFTVELDVSSFKDAPTTGRITISMNAAGDIYEDDTYSTVAIPAIYMDADTNGDPNHDPDNMEPIYSTESIIYDSLGNKHSLKLNFWKRGLRDDGTTSWYMSIFVDGMPVIDPATVREGLNPGILGFVEAIFDKNGILASPQAVSIYFDPKNGAEPMRVNIELSKLTHYAEEFLVKQSYQDGYQPGIMIDTAINESGIIYGIYSNGVSFPIARIALATFTNYQGLHKVGDNLFRVSPNSGEPMVVPPGERMVGKIRPNHLEMSNVDLAEEMTKLIIAQRAYQANARVITSADTILREVVALVR